jgi:hypothetical protein
MMKRINWFCIAIFIVFTGSCSEIAEFLNQPGHKGVVVTDSDLTWQARIREINGKTIFLVLVKNKPAIDTINLQSLMKTSIYSIDKVISNKIDFKLYTGELDYWTGSGEYYVLFVVPDKRAENVSQIYLSKQRHDFYAETTRMTNIDFMPPVDMNIDISGILPF